MKCMKNMTSAGAPPRGRNRSCDESESLQAPYLVWMVIFIVVPMLLVFLPLQTKSGQFTLENLAAVGSTPMCLSSFGLEPLLQLDS